MKNITKILVGAILALGITTDIVRGTVVFDTATVGDIGNASDANGYGSVGYEYEIGIYEVTNTQYAAFLNATAKSDPYGLYNTQMGSNSVGGIIRSGVEGDYTYTVRSNYEDRPVNFVSLADAARFCNWLTNGQGEGSTETGAYDFSSGSSIVRMTAPAGTTMQFFVASENEWYKAAYYDPTLNEGEGGYWAYATMSNEVPTMASPTGVPNSANYGRFVDSLTVVGAYRGSSSYYGTFDQEGNVGEFTDTLQGSTNGSRVRRGASFSNSFIGAANRTSDTLETEANSLGFRIVVVHAIPEPSSLSMAAATLLVGGLLWKRRASLCAKERSVEMKRGEL